jgi:phage gp45-like
LSRNTKEDFARERSPRERRSRGLTRRMRIRSSAGAQWQVTGYTFLGQTETDKVEPFSGVGFYARPRASSRAEAVVITIGEAQHSVIVATRDEDLRRLWKAELDAGEDVAAMFNSATIVLCKSDGTVEIRSRGGEAKRLLTVDDGEALKSAINGAATTGGDGGAAFKAALLAALAAWPTGTLVLKGE